MSTERLLRGGQVRAARAVPTRGGRGRARRGSTGRSRAGRLAPRARRRGGRARYLFNPVGEGPTPARFGCHRRRRRARLEVGVQVCRTLFDLLFLFLFLFSRTSLACYLFLHPCEAPASSIRLLPPLPIDDMSDDSDGQRQCRRGVTVDVDVELDAAMALADMAGVGPAGEQQQQPPPPPVRRAPPPPGPANPTQVNDYMFTTAIAALI